MEGRGKGCFPRPCHPSPTPLLAQWSQLPMGGDSGDWCESHSATDTRVTLGSPCPSLGLVSLVCTRRLGGGGL